MIKATPPKPDAKSNARQVAEFLTTEFGQKLIKTLSDQYNMLHHEAEAAGSAEHKAFKIERAAGIKWTIDYLIERDRLLREGFFDKQDA